jgi:hypothetical protein
VRVALVVEIETQLGERYSSRPKINLSALIPDFGKPGHVPPRKACAFVDIRNINEQNCDVSK